MIISCCEKMRVVTWNNPDENRRTCPCRSGKYILAALISASMIFQPLSCCMANQATAAGEYSVIIKKDPFDKSRGDAEDIGINGGGDKGDTQGIEDKYELHGVIRAGKIRKAYLKLRKPGRNKKKKSTSMFRTAVEGDMIDGWRIDEITDEGIVLTRSGKTVNMNVFSSRKARRRTKISATMFTKQSPPVIPPEIPGKVARAISRKNNKTKRPKTALKAPVMPKGVAHNPFARLLQQNRENMKMAVPSAGKPGLPVSAAPKSGN